MNDPARPPSGEPDPAPRPSPAPAPGSRYDELAGQVATRRGGRNPGVLLPIVLGLFLMAALGFVAVSFIASLFFGPSSADSDGMFSALRDDPIALVRIEAPIMPGPMFNFWIQTLRSIGGDDSVEAVIIRINSPGGSVGASQELYDEVLNLRSGGKTVYISMGDMATSGGYYIAAAADRIYANRGSLTGSIGVISTSYRVEGLAEKAGIEVEVIKSGRFKDSGSMFRPMREDERRMFDLLLDDTYEQFIDDVLVRREPALAKALEDFPESQWEHFLFERPEEITPRAFLLQIADGRAYSGAQAKELGLVDDLASLHGVVDLLADELGVDRRARTYEPRRQFSLFDMLVTGVRGAIQGPILTPPWPTWTLQYRTPGY